MKKQIVVMAVMLVVIPVGAWPAMSSTNFQISTTVMSGAVRGDGLSRIWRPVRTGSAHARYAAAESSGFL